MRILSHRGLWNEQEEQNQLVAFERSIQMGFGVELDVRDHAGKLVVSHDPPMGNELTFDEFLIRFDRVDITDGLKLAINIKADGLARELCKSLNKVRHIDYFVFDMSVPDMKAYLKSNLLVFGRVSEVEKDIPWVEKMKGVWLDCFYGDWPEVEDIEFFLDKNLEVCLVSPELHGRPYESFWQKIYQMKDRKRLLLCTDLPGKAKSFFGV